MRKFLTLLLVLCLAAVPCLSETTAHDFGAFTLTFPSDADGQIADEITDNSMFFLIYQDVAEDAQFRPNLNITWMEDTEDVTALDANATAETIMALTDRVVREKRLTAMMVTHNLRHALEYGDRILMLNRGGVVLDRAGEEKQALSIETLLDRFNRISLE